MRRLVRDTRGVSRLLLIVLLLAAFVLGAVLSYVWTMSYYAPKEFQLPSNSTVTIESVEFSAQDPSRFSVTILNPSFSPSSVSVDRIAVMTADNVTHDPTNVSPLLPHPLALGESQTFDCGWNWANSTNQAVTVLVWLEGGSGATLKVATPFVGLAISELEFDSSISVNRFNVTVALDPQSSITHVNVTSISLDSTPISADKVVQGLPHAVGRGEPVTFTCQFNWTDYQGESVTVVVETLQGYSAESSETTPQPVVLTIIDAVFNVTYTDHFNITIQNEPSPSDITIIEVSVTVEGEPTYTIEVTAPSLPQPLPKDTTIELKCPWDWSAFKGRAVTIVVVTSQGFTAYYSTVLPT